MTTNWTKQSGPGSVIFGNASATTEAILALNGVYVLRLSTTDAKGMVTDEVQVTVNASPPLLPTLKRAV